MVDAQCQSFKILAQRDDDDESNSVCEEIASPNNNTMISTSTSFIGRTLDPLSKKKIEILKLICAITAVILLLCIFISIVMRNDYTKESKLTRDVKNTSDNKTLHFSRALILTSDNQEIWIFDPEFDHYSILHESNEIIGPIEIYENQTLFWVEENLTRINSLSDDFPRVNYSKLLTPKAIAVDVITRKLYIVDEMSGTLNVVELNGDNFGLILSDLKKPCDLALDSVQGLMFIVQLHDSILRANMDGSSLQEIHGSGKPSAITINRITRRIYWANDYESIEASYYDGTNRIMLTQVSTNIVSLTIFENRLYWLISMNGNDTASLYSCELEKEICDNQSSHILPLTAHRIKSYQKQFKVSFKNPCGKENGNCEQLCLLTKNGKHNCGCSIGWELNLDKKTCQRVVSYALYSRGNYFRGKILNSTEMNYFVDAFLPVKYRTKSLEKRNTIYFVKSWVADEVFFSDDRIIYSFNLIDGMQTEIYQMSRNCKIVQLSIEILSKNLYAYQLCDSDNHSVHVLNIGRNKVFRKKILEDKQQFKSHAIVSCQNIFWYDSDRLSLSTSIDWMNLDGSNQLKFRDLSDNAPGVMACNYEEKLIYWIQEMNSNSMVIEYSSLEGGTSTNFTVYFSMENVKSMFSYQAWIFMSNSSSIFRVDKATGKNIVKVIPDDVNQEISGVEIVDSSISTTEINECTINNGNCEQFCFMDDKKKCDCEAGWYAKEDGTCHF